MNRTQKKKKQQYIKNNVAFKRVSDNIRTATVTNKQKKKNQCERIAKKNFIESNFFLNKMKLNEKKGN